MKVGVAGCGFVGSAAAYTLAMHGVASELVLATLIPPLSAEEQSALEHIASVLQTAAQAL